MLTIVPCIFTEFFVESVTPSIAIYCPLKYSNSSLFELLAPWELPFAEFVELSMLSSPSELILVCGCSVSSFSVSSLDSESDLTLFNCSSIFLFALSPVSVPKIFTDFNSLPLAS